MDSFGNKDVQSSLQKKKKKDEKHYLILYCY